MKITGDDGNLHHLLESGTDVTLDHDGQGRYHGNHWWRVVALEGAYKGRDRNVSCQDMKVLRLSEDEEAEVIARIQTSVQRGTP